MHTDVSPRCATYDLVHVIVTQVRRDLAVHGEDLIAFLHPRRGARRIRSDLKDREECWVVFRDSETGAIHRREFKMRRFLEAKFALGIVKVGAEVGKEEVARVGRLGARGEASLAILRVAKFCARYGFTPDAQGVPATCPVVGRTTRPEGDGGHASFETRRKAASVCPDALNHGAARVSSVDGDHAG